MVDHSNMYDMIRFTLLPIFVSCILIFLNIQPVHLLAQEAVAETTIEAADSSIVSQAKYDVDSLTSEYFAGRGYIHDGHIKASEYIKKRFRASGLEPVQSRWFQPFDMPVNIIRDSYLVINGDSLQPGVDYLPHATSGSGAAHHISDIHYAEQGLFIPSKEINQLPIYSAPGSMLIMDDYFPDSLKSYSEEMPTFFSNSYRIQVAQAIKANSLIFLTPELTYGVPYFQSKIPVFDVLEHSWPLSLDTISYKVDAVFDTVTTRNVYAKIEGTVHPDSTIILSAHYDHFGLVSEGHHMPGANDNASGVAMLLALADYFNQHPTGYTMLFVGFSGEEAGLKGSDYLFEHAPVDLDKTAFMLNFDMVASGEDGIVAVGGKTFPNYFNTLKNLADTSNKEALTLKARKNAPNSDHYRFLKRGIPGFYLYTNNGKQPYHHISDIPDTLEWDDFMTVYHLTRKFLESEFTRNIAN